MQWAVTDNLCFADLTAGHHLPQFFSDCPVYKRLCARFQTPRKPGDDFSAVLLFAMAGAGKTRTVCQAVEAAGSQLLRVRLNAPPEDFGAVKRDDEKLAADLAALKGQPDDVRMLAVEVMENYWTQRLATFLPNHGRVVLHFDECQQLMTSASVWQSDTPAPRDPASYHLAGLLRAADRLMARDKTGTVHVVFSGTNAWAPLVLKGASAFKPFVLPLLDGTLPVDWVMETLIPVYAKVDPRCWPVVQSLCYNRRHIRLLVTELHLKAQAKGPDTPLTVDEVAQCAERAVAAWVEYVLQDVQKVDVLALRAVALVLFPKAFGGIREGNLIKIPAARVHAELAAFIRAGGLNASVTRMQLCVAIPQGALMEFLLSITRDSLDKKNIAELDAFMKAAETNGPDKGHAFERMVACEATLLNSGFVVAMAEALSLHDYVVDPHAIGRPFEYAPRVYEAMDDDRPRVLCVNDDMKTTERLVDLGIPMYNPELQLRKKAYLELKYVSSENMLWRQCYHFFAEMKRKQLVGANTGACAVFVSVHPFVHHNPQQRTVKKGKLSAHDARDKAMDMLGPYFAILEMSAIPKQQLQFPLHDVLSYAYPKVAPASPRRYPGSTPVKKK